jgi:hypothetical protein
MALQILGVWRRRDVPEELTARSGRAKRQNFTSAPTVNAAGS